MQICTGKGGKIDQK